MQVSLMQVSLMEVSLMQVSLMQVSLMEVSLMQVSLMQVSQQQSWGAENNQWLFSCSTVNCTVHEYRGHTNLWNNTCLKICSRRSNILFLLASGITYLKLPTHNAWLTQFNRCKDVCRWWKYFDHGFQSTFVCLLQEAEQCVHVLETWQSTVGCCHTVWGDSCWRT